MRIRQLPRLALSLALWLLLGALAGCAEPTARGATPGADAEPERPLVRYSGEKGADWAAYEALVREQKFEAASAWLANRLDRVRAAGDGEGWARTLIEWTKLRMALHGYEKAVRFLKEQPWPPDLLGHAVLSYYYAEALRQYARMYSWQVNQRERVATGDEVDLDAWTMEQIHAAALAAHLAVWGDREALGALPVAALSEHLDGGTYPERVRPTLRDAATYLLAELLLDSQGWRPEHSNEVYRLDLDALLADPLPDGTTRIAFLADPAAHPLARAVVALEDLEAWHTARGEVEAALEARLVRLRGLSQHFREADDQARLRDHLRARLDAVQDTDWWAVGAAFLAELTRGEDAPDAEVRAHAIAADCVARKGGTIGGRRCRHVVAAIEAPSYQLQAMRADAAGKRSIGVNHRNLERLHFRAWPLDVVAHVEAADDYRLLPDSADVSALMAGEPAHSWSVALPPTPDYRSHRTYVVPPMEAPGLWIVVASARADFAKADNQIVAAPMVVGDLVLVTRQEDGALEVSLRSGATGRAVRGAEVRLYRHDWKAGHAVAKRGRTDRAGVATFRGLSRRSSYFVIATHGDDVAIDPNFLRVWQQPDMGEQTAALVFTDRSIYRPRQTIHWKAVVYRGDRGAGSSGDLRTVAGESVSVELVDPNGEVVETAAAETNDYGTASGSLVVPGGRLLGAWRVRVAPDGEALVRVEEYVRPTFQAEFADAEAPLRLNREATLKGEARYYFGLPVTGAAVKWRVSRAPVYPWWWWTYWRGGGSASTQVIATGTATTDEDGVFRFSFLPEADPRTAAQRGVSYRFAVTAEVLDEGGETRTAARTFRLGFVSVEARIASDRGFFRAGKGAALTVTRSDLDGTPAPGGAMWRLVRVDAPVAALLPADQPLPPPRPAWQDAYRTPGDDRRPRWQPNYNEAAVVQRWPDGAEEARGALTHGEDGVAAVSLPPLEPGPWRLRYTTEDPFGATYETFHDFVVAGPRPRLPLPAYLKIERSSVPVGGTARVLVGSGLPEQPVVFEIHRDGRLVSRRELVAGRDGALVELPVTAADRGGFGLVARVVRDHQVVQLSGSVHVPWSDKELAVSFATFRDRLRPGQKETWTVKVKAAEGDAAVGAAELLAYMYDRSLDVFAPHAPPSPLSLYPSRTGVSWGRANLGAAPTIWVDSRGFGALPAYPSLRPAHLQFRSGWGIGGPGMRGIGRGGGGVMLGKMKARMRAPSARPAPAPPMEEAAGEAEKTGFAGLASRGDVDQAQVGAGETRTADGGGAAPAPAVELRSDFSETAFWRPHLVTDADGTARIEFEVPDSVTSWNVWVHAVTKDLRAGRLHTEARTVKELMVRPYLPRFLREGDRAALKVVVNNAADRELSGTLVFDIVDPDTEESRLADFGLAPEDARRPFTVAAGGGANLTFPVTAPAGVGLVAVKVVATAGDTSDGELRPVPLLPGRIHLAQSRFVTLKDRDRRTMTFADLAADDDPTRIDEQLVVTVDGQLFYQVLAALPYLVNYPYECTEQTLNRYLSTGILGSLYDEFPAIRRMAAKLAARETRFEAFDPAGKDDPNRAMALEETPWLVQSRGGDEAAGDLANVLDPRVTEATRAAALAKLTDAQTASGGFPWFPGGPPSPYMTLYILHGFSKGLEFGVEAPRDVVTRAWAYLHRHYVDEVVADMMTHDCCWEFVTFLNYTLSNYPDGERPGAERDDWTGGVFGADERQQMLAFSFRHWREHAPYLKGYLALTLQRMGRAADARLVWESVMDSAKSEPDRGTFWAPEDRAWLWYNDTIETHAFAVRTVMELTPESPKLDGLVLWLFLNKKLNHWKSTRATAEVVYALAHYLKATGALGVREEARVAVGPVERTFVFEPDEYTGRKQQVVVPGPQIDPEASSTVVVEKETPGTLFASATWHFSTERLPAEARGDLLAVERRFFRRVKEGREVTLVPLADGAPIRPGDEVEVQLTLRAGHPVDYVHLRDPRGAGFEPVDTTSAHKWNLGVSWYEEIRDSGTNFFFEHLPQGEYPFRYRIRAAVAGTFRVAPATASPMYAPEFKAYSAGHALTIEPAE